MKTADTAELLRRHPFFAGLDEPALAFIAGCCTNVRFSAGQYVLREGQPADTFYLVRGGRVAIEVGAPGRETIIIDTVRAGEILGFSWLFPPYRCQFDARAVELTRALSIDGACLRAKCDQDPRLGYQLMQRIAGVMRQRLQSARLGLLDVYSSPTPAG